MAVTVACEPPETVPTEQGFANWVDNIMGVPDDVVNLVSLCTAYAYALEMVNLYLDWASPILYTQAVYNLAGDFLVNISQDDPDLPPPDNTYWADLRTSLQINNFVPGIINAANDQDTSAALVTPLNLQNLTLGDLQNLKTPWGRAYLSIAQSVGTMWGLS